MMDNEVLYWEKEWVASQFNLLTKHIYTGGNALKLSIIAYLRGYEDCRWLTLNQMQRNQYLFKNPESVKTEGVKILFVKITDKRNPYKSMNYNDKLVYYNQNVTVEFIPYQVYNCSLMDVISTCNSADYQNKNINRKIEKLISKPFVPIYYYGGDIAYYNSAADEIHLPLRTSFISTNAFYGTAMHELAHATGHKTRLNRRFGLHFGDENYALEELRAELASILIQLEYGCALPPEHLKNHAAYLQHWRELAKRDIDVMNWALTDASTILKFISDCQ
jgi:antirestriction protein ArdC